MQMPILIEDVAMIVLGNWIMLFQIIRRLWKLIIEMLILMEKIRKL